ncbi:MAG: isochorismate synthase [Thermocrispum sp.]
MTDTVRAEATDPADLLDGYRAGEFAFVTPERTVLAAGVDRELAGTDLNGIDDALAHAFAAAATPIAVGVLPFGTQARSRLVIPARFHSSGPAHAAIGRRPERVLGLPTRMAAVPSQQQHVAAVAAAVKLLRAGELHKVVLARALDVQFPAPVDPAYLLHNLVAENPGGFTFAAPLPGPRAATLVGSTPELLVRRSGNRVYAHPHAGTAPRSADPMLDAENAAGLVASQKERTEHALVVDAVVEALRPFCRRMTVPAEPSLTSTPAVWHLGTLISGELSAASADASALRLAAALHPTPAVCGTPTDAARDLAAELEPFDRGYYAGAVGWVDAAGDGEWAVSIRCAEVAGRDMRLYAGGGIVAASDPAAELAETSAKFTTLLRAMGITATS